MQIIVLPIQLISPVYVKGLRQPLETVADILDEQNQNQFALALRNAATICETFAKVNLEKTSVLRIK